MSKFSKAALMLLLPVTMALSSFTQEAHSAPPNKPAATASADSTKAQSPKKDTMGFEKLDLKKVTDLDQLAASYPILKYFLDEVKNDTSGPTDVSFATVKYDDNKPEVMFLRRVSGGQCGTLGCSLLGIMKHGDKYEVVMNVAQHGDVMIRKDAGSLKTYFCSNEGSNEWELQTIKDIVTQAPKPSFEPTLNPNQPRSPACKSPTL